MKIVIEIDHEHYERIMRIEEGVTVYPTTLALYEAVKNGTPLPKGHGRLIDADALEYTCNADECGMLTGCNHCQYHIVTEHEIDNAPTIIEADGGGEGE